MKGEHDTRKNKEYSEVREGTKSIRAQDRERKMDDGLRDLVSG